MLEEKQGEGKGRRSTSRTLATVTVLAVVVMVVGTWVKIMAGGSYEVFGAFLTDAAMPLATGIVPIIVNYIGKAAGKRS